MLSLAAVAESLAEVEPVCSSFFFFWARINARVCSEVLFLFTAGAFSSAALRSGL